MTQHTDWRSRASTQFTTQKASAIGSQGMIVTNNPLGSAAGAEMFAFGGNAIGAAIASLFALTVVEPMMVGVFGAGISTIRKSDGSHATINNYSVAPSAATPDMYKTVSDRWPDYQTVEDRENDIGPLAVGVPGSLKGWCETLSQFGTLSLADVMQPAIRYAERGYPATGYLCEIISRCKHDIAKFPETAKTYLPEGRPLKPGEIVVRSEYADTLKLIAQEGPAVLYDGELGAHSVDYLSKTGGIVSKQDWWHTNIPQRISSHGQYDRPWHDSPRGR